MARVNVPDLGVALVEAAEIRQFLQPYGIWYERWVCRAALGREAASDEILAAYSEEIERLKKRGGFQTADVINVNPDTPGLDAMLSRFSKEHTHSEDEVRFVVDGRGIFHINPQTAPVFSVEMEAGDLINVPAGTRHWFNLCSEKTICTIRLFEDVTGWAPHYLEDNVDQIYSPMCFNGA